MEIHDTIAHLRQFRSATLEFPIHSVGFAFVSEDAAPIGLLSVMERCPVPVFHHVGTTSEEGIHVLTELAVIRRPLIT